MMGQHNAIINIADIDGCVAYLDRNYPRDPICCLILDFRRGPAPWIVVQEALEYDGANPAVFLAELESL